MATSAGKAIARESRARWVAKWSALVVSVVLAAAWLGSRGSEYRVSYITGPDYNHPEFAFRLTCGAIGYQRIDYPGRNYPDRGFEWHYEPVMIAGAGGFVWMWGGRFRWWIFPLWVPLGVCVPVTVVLWVWEGTHARRRRLGLCLACGYDRRGLVDGAKCPECGAGVGGAVG